MTNSDKELFTPDQAVLYDDRSFGRKLVEVKARAPDTVAKIRSEVSNVIFLTEVNLAIMWLGYGAVFVGRCPAFDDRGHEKSNTANSQNSMYFRQSGAIVNMFEHVRTQDQIVAFVRQCNFFYVELKVAAGRDISSYV